MSEVSARYTKYIIWWRGVDVIRNEEELTRDLSELSESVKKMAVIVERVEKKRYFSIIEHPWKFVFFSFLQGIAISIGTTVGIAAVVTSIIWVFDYLGIFPGFVQTVKELIYNR